MEMAHITPWRRTLASSPKPNALVAISKRMPHAGSKTLLEQNPPVLNYGCQLMQVVLYNGPKTVVVVVVVVVP